MEYKNELQLTEEEVYNLKLENFELKLEHTRHLIEDAQNRLDEILEADPEIKYMDHWKMDLEYFSDLKKELNEDYDKLLIDKAIFKKQFKEYDR